jgi:hypothetical protein
MHERFLITKDEMLIKDWHGQRFSQAIKHTSKQILQVSMLKRCGEVQ